MKAVHLAVLALLLFQVFSGCQTADQERLMAMRRQMVELETENEKLLNQFHQYQSENERLHKRLARLTEIREKIKAEDIYNLRRVSLGRYTSLFDQSRDGQVDTLLVYIQPMDEQGDIIKAAGSVSVSLWDLNGEESLRLGQWEIGYQELRHKWFASVMTTNYRLKFDITEIIETFDSPLTLRVTFTDYLSGRKFEMQRLLQPD